MQREGFGSLLNLVGYTAIKDTGIFSVKTKVPEGSTGICGTGIKFSNFLNRWFSVRHQLNSTTSPTTLYVPKYKTVLLCMSPSTQKPSVLLNLLNPILGRYVGFWRAIG